MRNSQSAYRFVGEWLMFIDPFIPAQHGKKQQNENKKQRMKKQKEHKEKENNREKEKE